MDSKAMTRKDFITLTFTLIGSTALVARCSNDTDTNPTGAGGTTANNTGAGGTTGAAGTTGTAGTSAQAGTTGQGGSGAGTVTACAAPQLPDSNGHTHSVTVPASTLTAGSSQTFTTSAAGSPAHMHAITLTTADLATLAGGGSVTVTSTATLSHMHQFMVTCH